MDAVAESIEEARRLLGAGKNRMAADLLAVAAVQCADPNRAAMIHALAKQGQASAGRFGKRRWDQSIRLSEQYLTAARR